MKYFVLIGFLVIVTIAQGQTSCSALLDIPGMQSGIVEMKQLNMIDSQRHTGQISFSHYTIILSQPMPNSKAIFSLSSMNAETSTLDLFDLSINSLTDSEIQVTFIYEYKKWNEISYRYLLTNRTEQLYLQMSTFSESEFHLFHVDNEVENDDKEGKHMMLRAIATLDRAILQQVWNYKVLGFLRGLKYKNQLMKAHSLSLSISNPTLTQTTVQIDILSLPEDPTVQLQLLSISLIYFNPKQLTFVCFGGLVTRNNFIGEQKIDVLDLDLPGQLYEFFGISAIDLMSYDGFLVDSDIDEKFFFHLQVSKMVKKIDFLYFVIGIDAESVCSLCEGRKYLSGTECVQKCQVNETIYEFQNSSQLACLKHGNNTQDNQVKIQVKQQQKGKQQNTGEVTKVQNKPVIHTYEKESQLSFKQVVSAVPTKQQQNEKQAPKSQVSSKNNDDHIEQYDRCMKIENSYWTGESCLCKVGYVMNVDKCQQIVHNQFESMGLPQQQQKNQQVLHQDTNPISNQQSNFEDNPINNNQPTTSQSICHTILQSYNYQNKRCECINGLSYMQDLETQSFLCVICNEFEGFFSQQGMCKYCGQNKVYDSLLERCKCKGGFVELQSGECAQVVKKVVAVDMNIKTDMQDTQQKNYTNPSDFQQKETNNNNNQSSIIQHQEQQLQNTTQPTTNEQQNIAHNNPQSSSQFPLQTDQNNLQSKQFRYGSDIPQITSRVKSSSVVYSSLNEGQNKTNNSHETTNSFTSIPSFPTVLNNTMPTDCMQLSLTPQLNNVNLFLTLELSQQYTFKSQEQMRNFLQSQFNPSAFKPSAIYCNQQEENTKIFECLLIYNSGVPNQKYQVKFWYYDVQSGQKCSLSIAIDPLQSAAKSVRQSRKRL